MATGGIAAEIKRRRQEAKEKRNARRESGVTKARAGRDVDQNFEAGGNISDYDFGKKYNQRDVKRLQELGFSDDDIAADIAARDERIGGQQARYLRQTGNLNKVARTGIDTGLNEAFMRRRAANEEKRAERKAERRQERKAAKQGNRMAGDVFEEMNVTNSNNTTDNSQTNSNNVTDNSQTNSNNRTTDNSQTDSNNRTRNDTAGRDLVSGNDNLIGDGNTVGDGNTGNDRFEVGNNLASGENSVGGDRDSNNFNATDSFNPNFGIESVGPGGAGAVNGSANSGDQTQNIDNTRNGPIFSGNTFGDGAIGNFGSDFSVNLYTNGGQNINGGGGGPGAGSGGFKFDNYDPLEEQFKSSALTTGLINNFYQQLRFDPFQNAVAGQRVGGFTQTENDAALQDAVNFADTRSQELKDKGEQQRNEATQFIFGGPI